MKLAQKITNKIADNHFGTEGEATKLLDFKQDFKEFHVLAKLG